MFGLKSSPILSEQPFTQMPRLDKDCQVLIPLAHIIFVGDKDDSAGKADLREINLMDRIFN